jgi:putative chitinase
MEKYTVKTGDTLGSIAKKFYKDPLKYKDIAKANNISNPDLISVGQVLLIPELTALTKEEDINTALDTGQTSDKIFTEDSLKQIMPNAKVEDINHYLNALNTEMQEYDINTPLRAAHFIAQIAHESGSFKYSSENLNYSAKALRSVFGKYFPTDELAEEYARKPEKIANRVYANRMNNGNEASGDGWKYRGRGLIQLTGKENYTKCGDALKIDLVNKPDLPAQDANAAVAAAIWFWDSRKLNTYADQDNIKTITKLINGGYNGLEDRTQYLERAKQVLGI